MAKLKIALQDYRIDYFDAEFKQYYIATDIEYHGKKRQVIVQFEDPYEEIVVPDTSRVVISGELHEHSLSAPLNIVKAKFHSK